MSGSRRSMATRWMLAVTAVVLVAGCRGNATPPRRDVEAPAGTSAPGIENDATPRQIGGRPRAVAVVGDRAFVAIGPRLAVVDISQSPGPDTYFDRMTALGQSDVFDGPLRDVAVDGGIAVLAGPGPNLTVVDVSRPEAPVAVGTAGDVLMETGAHDLGSSAKSTPPLSLPLPQPLLGEGAGGWGPPPGTTDPRSTDPPIPAPSPFPQTIAARSRHAYVAGAVDTGGAADRTGARGRLVVVDLAVPSSPRPVARLDLPGRPTDIAIDGRLLFIASGDAGVRIVDVADPAAPREVGHIGTPARAAAVAVAGGYAFVAEQDPLGSGIQVADVRNPAAPREIASLTLARRRADVAVDVRAIAVDGPRAWVATADGARLVDVSDPAAPRELAVDGAPELRQAIVPGAPALGAADVAVAAGRAYVLDAARGLAEVGADGGGAAAIGAEKWSEKRVWLTPTTVTDVSDLGADGRLLVVAAGRVLLVDPGRAIEPDGVVPIRVQGHALAQATSEGRIYIVSLVPPRDPADTVAMLALSVVPLPPLSRGDPRAAPPPPLELGPYTFDVPRLAADGDRAWVWLRDRVWVAIDASDADAGPRIADIASTLDGEPAGAAAFASADAAQDGEPWAAAGDDGLWRGPVLPARR